jgi:hypothetical protein
MLRRGDGTSESAALLAETCQHTLIATREAMAAWKCDW